MVKLSDRRQINPNGKVENLFTILHLINFTFKQPHQVQLLPGRGWTNSLQRLHRQVPRPVPARVQAQAPAQVQAQVQAHQRHLAPARVQQQQLKYDNSHRRC